MSVIESIKPLHIFESSVGLRPPYDSNICIMT